MITMLKIITILSMMIIMITTMIMSQKMIILMKSVLERKDGGVRLDIQRARIDKTMDRMMMRMLTMVTMNVRAQRMVKGQMMVEKMLLAVRIVVRRMGFHPYPHHLPRGETVRLLPERRMGKGRRRSVLVVRPYLILMNVREAS